jgi:poly(3-hydroxybutyrate) depolymerase
MRRILHGILFCCFLLATTHAWAKDSVNKLVFTYDGHPRTVYYYAPDTVGDLPIVVLLHGSGRDGTEMLNAWKSLAVSEHFILAAPNSLDPAVWDSQNDPPAFLHAVVEQVGAKHVVDPSRIYLFGHSGGAVYALAMALVDSEYYAATAVHAGALPPQNEHLFTYPKRKMPIALWVGDRDAFFPPDRVTATKAMFEAHGFQVQLTVIANHSHNYDEASEKVDRQAWQFFKDVQLPSPNQ